MSEALQATPVEFDPFAGPAIEAAAPTTEPQREVWTAAALGDEASLAYNESVSLRLRGALDAAALRQALDDLVARHESLRATFSPDGLTLLVAPAAPAAFALHQGRAPEDVARQAVSRQMDLQAGPLFFADLVQVTEAEHVLVLTGHHLICDGWSTGVLVKDLAALYSARVRGQPPLLPAAESFSAYARAEAAPHNAQRRAAQEKWWIGTLAGELAPLELPTDRPRPKRKTQRSIRIDQRLGPELCKKLKLAAAKERASLFTSLLSGFVALLHRLGAAQEVVVGIPSAGQAAQGNHELVGHCVNLLPVRARVSGEEPVRALVGRVQRAMMDALEHRDISFGHLLQELPLPRDPSRLPLVEVLFNLDRGLPEEVLRFEGLAAELWTNPRVAETYDLFLNATELPSGIQLECQANADLFDAGTIGRWLEIYQLLLSQMAEAPEAELASLSILTESDRLALEAWNDAAALAVPEGALVHQLISAQARRTPEAVAVEQDGVALTYRELDERSNRLAQRLRKAGVSRGALVGLCAERSPQLIAGLVGILKAGGAYVPLDPGYPKDRLAFMAADAQMAALVTERKLCDELPLPAGAVVLLDDPTLPGESAEPLPHDERGATPESPAYVIYTSGSTGKPKGVLVPHRAAANLLASVAREPGMTAHDVVLAVTTLSFDIALSELVLPLTVGARIALASREVASDGLRLLRRIESAGVTFIDATPATYRLLLEAGWQGKKDLTLICTGEALPRDLAEELLPRCGALWNGYGPTETCVWSTFWRVPHGLSKVLIGKPVANTVCKVLDARMREVPVGVPGELYLGGRGVALGYLNRPDLTAQRFLRVSPEGTLYKTGDVVRFLPTGELEYLGRGDGQVKLRGYRIELGEIEDALARAPGVRQAAVALREDQPGDRRLAGYVVGDAVDAAALRAHLRQTLPDYMIPSAFVHLSKLPLTPSGKVDRRALPAPEKDERQAGQDHVEPRSESERLLAALFREALSVARVSVHDDFFALGGHSLLASQVLARLRKDHGVELSFRTLFEAPTIARLAPLLVKRDAAAAGPSAIPRRQGRGPAPLTLLQERLYRLEEMEPRQKLVHLLPAAWRLRGPLDVPALEAALQRFVARHEPLRTGFEERGGQLLQIVEKEVALPLLHIEAREEELERIYQEEMARPFDRLDQPPLLRVLLIKLGAGEHVLFTLRHNLVWDGWSFDIFLRELVALAAGKPLPELPIGYTDFAAWHKEWLRGSEIARQADYWRKQLAAPPPPLELPADRARPQATSHRGANQGVVLPLAELEALQRLARETGTTLFMVLFAAFNTLLHRWSGQPELLVGTPVRARTRTELEDLVGPFINQVLLRTRLDSQMTFIELLAQVKETTLDAFSHQDVPLELALPRVPPVRALFSLQDAKNRPLQLAGAQVSQLHVLPPTAAADLMLWTMETKTGLLAMLNYATDLFDEATAKRLLSQLRMVLAAAAADARRPLGDLALLAPDEEAQLAAFEEPGAAPVPPAVREAGALDVLRDLPDLLLDGDGLLDELGDSGAKVLRAPAESLQRLCDAGFAGSRELQIVSVEPLPDPLREALRSRCQQLVETALWKDGAPALIDGRPAPGVAFRVLDGAGRRAPIGVPGQLWQGAEPTGERALWRASGKLELLGRADGQVRLHGQLLDLRALEGSLKAAPGVALAHAGLREGRLVAWVVARPGGDPPTASALRRQLRRSWPEWALPRDFALLPELPGTAAGAVDEAMLPLPWASREKVAPRTPSEKLLAELWQEALGVTPSAHDNFFDLGGHSLTCLQVVGRIAQRTGKRLSPRILLLGSLAQAAAELDRPAAK